MKISASIISSIAWTAAVFCVIVSGILVYEHTTAITTDPWKSPQLLALKGQLAAAPKDEKIKTEIRELDLAYRERFFHRLELDRTGSWLLLGGASIFLLAAKYAAKSRTTPPLPEPNLDPPGEAARQASAARRGVAVVGIAAAAALAWVSLSGQTALSSKHLDSQKHSSGVAESDLPPLAEFQANWPRFRGPDGSGASTPADVPLSWDEKSGTGIAWKSPIPGPGFNSPIVWNDRVFISGGTAAKREVYCYDTATGRLVWQRAVENVPESPLKLPDIPEQTGFAAPTMASDGKRVYVIFANGDLAALTFDGNVVWAKNLGVPKNQYGHATSLAIWQGRVIVQLDQGESGPANSRLTAFDGATGRAVWEKSRPVASSWATPIVIEAAGKTQIITLGVPWVIAYSFADGSELWRAELLDGEVAPSPLFAGGLVCVISPSSKIVAIRPDGSGDVTKTHIAWTSEENVPDVTSPATNGELIFYVTSSGLVTCLDAKDGKKQWEHDFGFEVQASPGIAGNRVYVIGTSGEADVLEAGRQFKQLAKCATDDKLFASPAFAGGRIYLRGTGSLYSIALKK